MSVAVKRILELLADGGPEAVAECLRLRAMHRPAWRKVVAGELMPWQWNVAAHVTRMADSADAAARKGLT